jgi:hypothetical protein
MVWWWDGECNSCAAVLLVRKLPLMGGKLAGLIFGRVLPRLLRC